MDEGDANGIGKGGSGLEDAMVLDPDGGKVEKTMNGNDE